MKKEKVITYRMRHTLIAIASILMMATHFTFFHGFGNIIWNVIIIATIGEQFERKDEYVKFALNKATNITFWVLFLAVFLVWGISEHVHWQFFQSDMYFFLSFGAVTIRSIIYVYLDRPEKDPEDE